MPKNNAMVLFAVLFATADPIPLFDVQAKLGLSDGDMQAALIALKTVLSEHSPFHLQEVGDKVLLATRPEYGEYLKKIVGIKKRTLSDAALETLSVIAYRQPVLKGEIDKIRGCDCDAVLDKLLREDLIKAVGSISAPGSPVFFQTTEKFLVTFNLKALKDLPEIV